MTRADGNKSVMGRPLKFKSVTELQEAIDKYFADATEQGLPYTITGLALALDTSRETLLDYEAKQDFSDNIKRAKLRCHNYAENYLYTGKNATEAIFNLKNNYGWKDKTEVDSNINGNVSFINDVPRPKNDQ